MRDAHGGFRFIDVLTAGAGSAVHVDFQILFINLQIDFLGFGQNGDRRRGRMHAPRRFRFRHALDTVNARFEFQPFKHVAPRDAGGRLLIPADTGIVDGQHFKFPALRRRIMFVHTEQFGGEQSRFLPARTGANFQNRVLFINGVFRQQQNLQPFFQFRQFFLGFIDFIVRHRPHFIVRFRIVQHSLRAVHIRQNFFIGLNRRDDFLQSRQFLGKLDKRVAVHAVAGTEQCLQFLVPRQNDVQFFFKAHLTPPDILYISA